MSESVPNLPPTSDDYWEGAKTFKTLPVSINICSTHDKKNWIEHVGYINNHDGTIRCKYCPWGSKLPGYYRVIDERIVDLRG